MRGVVEGGGGEEGRRRREGSVQKIALSPTPLLTVIPGVWATPLRGYRLPPPERAPVYLSARGVEG